MHSISDYHIINEIRWLEFKNLPKNASVASLLSDAYAKTVEDNKQYLKYLFFAAHGISFIWADESEISENKGKFA